MKTSNDEFDKIGGKKIGRLPLEGAEKSYIKPLRSMKREGLGEREETRSKAGRPQFGTILD